MHAHKCGCMSVCNARTQSCLLPCKQAISVWAHACAHVHKCSLESSSCVPVFVCQCEGTWGCDSAYVFSLLGRRICAHMQQCMCVHACTCLGPGEGCLPMGMSVRILASLLKSWFVSSSTCGHAGLCPLSTGEGANVMEGMQAGC